MGDGRRSALGALWRHRRALVLARAAAALSLLGAGIILGWSVGSDRDLVEAEPAPSSSTENVSDEDPEGPEAPDVRGLAVVDAQQVVADFGIPASDVTLSERPAAGQRGIVVAQDPAFGFAVEGTMTLYVSTPAKVPEFSGRDAETVLDELDGLGAEVTLTSLYSPGVPVGEIASITPPPGTVVDGPVDVVISTEADQLPLSAVPIADGSCYSEVVGPGEGVDSMNGTDFDDLFQCSAGPRDERQAWVLKRAADRLTGFVGVPDTDGSAGQSVIVVISGDGRELGTYTASYGETADVDVDVTDVLRLTVRYRAVGGADRGDTVVLGMGGLTLSGDPTALSGLDGRQS